MPASRPIRRSVLLGIALLYQAPGHAQVPSGGTVVGGIAHINQPDATHQVINQATPKAIINWKDFSIGSGSQVRFNQPSSSSVILNRVTGADPSNINGSLSANGQVFLVNPQGVYFGAGASVDVAGLLATTLNIGNDDFLAGRYQFTRDLVSGNRRNVINAGILKAREGGYVVLAGDYVTNSGVIQARLGTAALASGSKMTLDIDGDNLVNFIVNEKTVAELSGVENSGQLLADGGRAIMTAAVANQLTTAAVNNTGLVQARSVEQRNGAIYLGSDGGDVQLSGTLDASGTGAGQTGGTIDVTGNNVALQDTAQLDVSSDAGGGKVQVGGGFQGKGSLANAQTVSVASGARIKADALGNGNGGGVVVWSDRHTAYAGNISAQGGAQGGDGGNVEVSGKLLDYSGKVSTLAAHGNTGNLLLDPIDIRILNPGLIVTPTPGGVSQMTVGALETALNANNVTLQTSAGSGAPNGGTITIDDGSGGGVQWGAATTLKLQANNSIAINSTVEGYNGTLWLDAPNGAIQKGGTVIGANSLLLSGGGNWDLAGVGSSSTINSYNNVNTLAANISGGGLLEFSNSKNLTIGSVSGVNGLSHANGTTWFYLDQNNGALNLAQDVSSNILYLRASGGTTQTGGKISAGNLALVGGAATLNRSGNHVGNLMASINGALSYTDSGALNIGSIYGINGITSSNHNVTLVTGDASGYDSTKPPDGTNPASLTLNQGINAGTGAISLTAGTGGVYQAHAVDSDGKPLTAGSLTGGALVLRGGSSTKVTPFILNNANNRIGTLAASLNGSLSYTGGPLTVGSVGGVNGITTTSNTVVVAAGTDSSGRATPAVYNDNNVSLSIGGDLSINQNIDAATSTGSGSVSIGMGGDFTAATGSGVRINANTLGVFGDDLQGKFTLTTNVSSLAAAGGKVMVIDNSAYRGDLTALGIGAPATDVDTTDSATGNNVNIDSASKPVGDFYLTTGGGLNVIKLISKGDYLMLRANSLNILLDASTADNANIMLQPYDLSRSIGINNSTESGYGDTYATNYSAELLNKFTNPTATFFFGTPQNAIFNDAKIVSAANNTQTGDIHIGYDGGFDLGYRSLSAQTSGNLVAYNVGPLYNLRLAAPNLTINGFNTFGDQIHLFSNNLQLPGSGDKYVNPNKPTITLRSLKDETIWVGNISADAARSGETGIKSTTIQKLPDWSTVVISGSTDYPFPSGGPGYGDIHIPWDDGFGVQLGHRTLVLSTGHDVHRYTGSPAYTQKNDGGTSGGLWQGCQNLSTCQGTNPDPYPSSAGGGDGSDGNNSDTGNTGNSSNSNSGDCPTCSPAPPNKNPFPPDTTPTGGGNGNNGSGDGSGSNGASSTGGGDGGAGADGGGAGDGGAGSGGSGTGDGGGGAGTTGDGGGDGGAGAGSGGAGNGANGNGTGDGGAGSGATGSGGGDGGAGTGSGGAGDGGNGAGNGGTGNGAGGAGANGDGTGGAGDGTGGAGNGGAGNGSGAGGAGGGDGGAGTGGGGAGDGAGDGGAGAGAGGAGDGSGGNGSGGAGSGATGTGGGDGGAGTGSGGAGDGGNGNGAGGGAGDGGAANGGTGDGGNGAGTGDGGTGTGAGGAGNGANGDGGGDGGAGTGDGGNGNGGNGGGATGAGAGNGGAGNGADGAGGGDGGAGTGGGGAGGDAGGSANDGANAAGTGAGGAGDGNGGNGAGDNGAGGGDGGAGTGSGGAGSNGDGAGGGDAGAGSGGNGNGHDGGAGGAGDGNGGNGGGGDGSGGGDAGAGTGDGGAGDGGAGAADGGAGNGNGGHDGSNGNTGSPDTGKGGSGGAADEAGGGDSGAGTGDGDTASGNHGNGDNGAGRSGGNQDANGANSNGGAGNGEAGNGGNGGDQSANDGDDSGDRNAAAPSSPAVDLDCDAVVNAKTPPPEDTDQTAKQQLLAIKGDGVKLGNPCQKQPESAGKGN